MMEQKDDLLMTIPNVQLYKQDTGSHIPELRTKNKIQFMQLLQIYLHRHYMNKENVKAKIFNSFFFFLIQ